MHKSSGKSSEEAVPSSGRIDLLLSREGRDVELPTILPIEAASLFSIGDEDSTESADLFDINERGFVCRNLEESDPREKVIEATVYERNQSNSARVMVEDPN